MNRKKGVNKEAVGTGTGVIGEGRVDGKRWKQVSRLRKGVKICGGGR